MIKNAATLLRRATLSLSLAFAAVTGGFSQDANAQGYGYDRQQRTDEYFRGYVQGTEDARYYESDRRHSGYRYDDPRSRNCVDRTIGGAVIGGIAGAIIGDNSRSARRGAVLLGGLSALDCVSNNNRYGGRYGQHGYHPHQPYYGPRYENRRWDPPHGQRCVASHDRYGQPVLICR